MNLLTERKLTRITFSVSCQYIDNRTVKWEPKTRLYTSHICVKEGPKVHI